MPTRDKVQEIHTDMPHDGIHVIQMMPPRTPWLNGPVVIALILWFLHSYLEQLHPGSTTQGAPVLMTTVWMIAPHVVLEVLPWSSFSRAFFLGNLFPKFLPRCTYYATLADFRNVTDVMAGNYGRIGHPRCHPGYETIVTCTDPQRAMYVFFFTSSDWKPCDSAFTPTETQYKMLGSLDDPDGPGTLVPFVQGHGGLWGNGHVLFAMHFLFCLWMAIGVFQLIVWYDSDVLGILPNFFWWFVPLVWSRVSSICGGVREYFNDLCFRNRQPQQRQRRNQLALTSPKM